MKRIEVELTDENIHGMFAISFVDQPAIQSGWVALRDHKAEPVKLSADNAKHIVTGPILIPDLPIYRQMGGEEFEIVFTESVIERLRDKYMKEKRTDQVTEMHEGGINGVYLVEMWMVADPEQDKSAALGIPQTKGTLMASMKVDNLDLWAKVAEGDYTGFSIEAYLDLEKIVMSQHPKEDELVEAVVEVLSELLK